MDINSKLIIVIFFILCTILYERIDRVDQSEKITMALMRRTEAILRRLNAHEEYITCKENEEREAARLQAEWEEERAHWTRPYNMDDEFEASEHLKGWKVRT